MVRFTISFVRHIYVHDTSSGTTWLLGVFEVILFRGMAYYLSWRALTRILNHVRNSASAPISSAFGTLLALCGIHAFSRISTDSTLFPPDGVPSAWARKTLKGSINVVHPSHGHKFVRLLSCSRTTPSLRSSRCAVETSMALPAGIPPQILHVS